MSGCLLGVMHCTKNDFLYQEEYIKEEQRNLKRELLRAQEEVRRIQSVPLVIGQFLEMVDNNNGIGLLRQVSSSYPTSLVLGLWGFVRRQRIL